ncbi:MAG: polyphosphate:AMP phosphotransferase [Lachnospiraceae bacterium]|nr:polyphosphate:AMP phosphotransferase [Lachnospiraceae bacterium]
MLEQLDLTKSMPRDEYKERMEVLEPELSRLQRTCKSEHIPVIIVFEGFSAAGKGEQISRLIHALDPRGFYVNSIGPESEEEQMHPFLWRFWTKLPSDTQIAVFDRSWYRKVVVDHVDKKSDDSHLATYYNEINSFERQLTDGGTVIIKFFLCIDQKEQKKRFKKLLSSDASAWRVSENALEQNKKFDTYKQMYDDMLEQTDTACAPWTIVEAMDRRFATVKIYTAVIEALKTQVAIRQAAAEGNVATQAEPTPASEYDDEVLRTSSLNKVDLSLSLSKEEYRSELKKLQNRIEELHGEIYKARIPVILGFEGWDAGGKGGAIKRLTEKMDPRGYIVHPTSAANDIEKVHHYLWRFWNSVPKDGHIAIFDRTWYGRVMVERIEGFCTTDDWHRAYQEINEMEKQFVEHGAIVIKFWMQIDKDEQERRFNERMENPEKQWKITDEDWRNREKWDAYEKAVDEMLVRTSTSSAPWIIVEGNCKYYARIKVLRTVVDAMEERLKKAKK